MELKMSAYLKFPKKKNRWNIVPWMRGISINDDGRVKSTETDYVQTAANI